MPDLDLSDAAVATFAARVEEQQRAYGAIRYGSAFRVGAARVVLNPDAPFATANFAGTMTGSRAVAEATLARLPGVWAEAEMAPVILLDSPSCLPELPLVAEESGYEAVEEPAVMLLADRTTLLDGEPGILTRPVSDRDDPAVLAAVLGDAFGWAAGVERSFAGVLGQRLDDPRVEAVVAEDGGEVAGAAFAFVQGDLAYVTDTGVRQESRGRAPRCTPSRSPARVVWLAAEAWRRGRAVLAGGHLPVA